MKNYNQMQGAHYNAECY